MPPFGRSPWSPRVATFLPPLCQATEPSMFTPGRQLHPRRSTNSLWRVTATINHARTYRNGCQSISLAANSQQALEAKLSYPVHKILSVASSDPSQCLLDASPRKKPRKSRPTAMPCLSWRSTCRQARRSSALRSYSTLSLGTVAFCIRTGSSRTSLRPTSRRSNKGRHWMQVGTVVRSRVRSLPARGHPLMTGAPGRLPFFSYDTSRIVAIPFLFALPSWLATPLFFSRRLFWLST